MGGPTINLNTAYSAHLVPFFNENSKKKIHINFFSVKLEVLLGVDPLEFPKVKKLVKFYLLFKKHVLQNEFFCQIRLKIYEAILYLIFLIICSFLKINIYKKLAIPK